MRLLFKLVLPLLLIAGSIGVAGYLRATKPAVEPKAAVERIWTVTAVPVSFADHRPVLKLYGEIVAGREVVLRPLAAGEVIATAPNLVDGGRFEAGEMVLRIDPFDYEAAVAEIEAQRREAEADLRELESNLSSERAMLQIDREELEIADRDLARYTRLRGSAAASEQAFDNAQMVVAERRGALEQRSQSLAMLAARIDAQRARIDRLGVTSERAKRTLEQTTLEAPFAGFVTDVEVAVGKRIGEGDPIAKLIDRDRLEIRFQLSDRDFGRLWRDGLIGRELSADWRLGGTAFGVEGEVARVESRIDSASGGVVVFARITANPDDAPLRPGAFVEIELPDQLYPEAVELPLSALHGGETIYVVEAGRLAAVPVEVVARRANTILVRGDLDSETRVVTSRIAEIGPGLKVEIQE